MGLLDDAIREHLDLKRQHGAREDELAREEAEALGPLQEEEVAEEDPGAPPASSPDRGGAWPFDRVADDDLTGPDEPSFDWGGEAGSGEVEVPPFVPAEPAVDEPAAPLRPAFEGEQAEPDADDHPTVAFDSLAEPLPEGDGEVPADESPGELDEATAFEDASFPSAAGEEPDADLAPPPEDEDAGEDAGGDLQAEAIDSSGASLPPVEPGPEQVAFVDHEPDDLEPMDAPLPDDHGPLEPELTEQPLGETEGYLQDETGDAFPPADPAPAEPDQWEPLEPRAAEVELPPEPEPPRAAEVELPPEPEPPPPSGETLPGAEGSYEPALEHGPLEDEPPATIDEPPAGELPAEEPPEAAAPFPLAADTPDPAPPPLGTLGEPDPSAELGGPPPIPREPVEEDLGPATEAWSLGEEPGPPTQAWSIHEDPGFGAPPIADRTAFEPPPDTDGAELEPAELPDERFADPDDAFGDPPPLADEAALADEGLLVDEPPEEPFEDAPPQAARGFFEETEEHEAVWREERSDADPDFEN